MSGKTSSESKKKYNEKTYDKLTVQPRKDVLTKAQVEAAAAAAGVSPNQYVIEAILEKMRAGV